MAGITSISLVVPCFNEAERLCVEAFRIAALDGVELELVFVDDGSTDSTLMLLERIRAEREGPTRVLKLPHNRGKAEAVRHGMLDALTRTPEAVGYWDADLATPFTELAAFIGVLNERPAIDVVLGSRVRLMGRAIERQAWRHYVGRIFATGASLTLELPVYDTQCGAKLFRAGPLLPRVLERPFTAGWIFDVELLARFLVLDPRDKTAAAAGIYELPLSRWADVRGSKLKPADFVRAAFQLARIRSIYLLGRP